MFHSLTVFILMYNDYLLLC